MPASGRAPNGRGSAQRRKRRVGGLATHRHPRHAKRKTRSPEGKVWVADHWPRQIHRCTPLWTYEYRARERKPSNPISGCSRPTTRAVLSGRNWDDPEGHGHPPDRCIGWHEVCLEMASQGAGRGALQKPWRHERGKTRPAMIGRGAKAQATQGRKKGEAGGTPRTGRLKGLWARTRADRSTPIFCIV